MLDDLKYIHERDAADALGSAEHQLEQLTARLELTGNAPSGTIANVVYVGMGGSAVAAQLLYTWLVLSVPIEIVRDYDIPGYVDEHTLFIAASCSGNTEETLSALSQAAAKGAHIAVITGGGTLQKVAEENEYLCVVLPRAAHPRYGVFYTVRALIQVLEAVGLLSGDMQAQLAPAADAVMKASKAWRPDVPTTKNLAKQIAQELIGKSIVVYSGPKLSPAAYKWKIDFNENAKHIAWVSQVPEFNHNEFTGWTKQPVDKPYAVIDLRSTLEHERVQQRFVISERLLSGVRPSPIVINAEGRTLLEQLLWTMVLGDFTSLYLALLNGLNPTPLPFVEKLKQALNDA
jgi:glucose/mannose-6-phosphate isomerase